MFGSPRSKLFVVTLAAGVGTLSVAEAVAQTPVAVSVNAGAPLGHIPAAAFGVNTAVWDGNLQDGAVPKALSAAGIGALRYPGGSTADNYNWQTNSIVPGQGSYANPSNGFDAFMGLATKLGAAPIVTVNYGSNTAGNGGGTAAFAASWVQYANITHGYGVKYWEIGNEIYGNGEYGASWETDLHPAHDPTTYGANVAQFAQAMKAVDPGIKVGAVLTAPGNWPDGQSPDWNSNVLAQCGSSIDFVIVHWYAQQPGNETDAGLLASPQNGVNGTPGIAAMTAKLRSLIAQYGGSNAANIKIFFTETNSVAYNPGKQTVSLVNALFAADSLLTWVENGAANVDVWDLHNGSTNGNASSSLYGSNSHGDYGILANGSSGEPAADTPFPTYYGLQMLTEFGWAGDTLVSSGSGTATLATHAVLQANGNLAVLLVNKDPNNAVTANVSVAGYTPAATGTVYTYGKAGGAIAANSAAGLGSTFSATAAPYSLTTVVLSPGASTAPAPGFSLTPAASSVSLTPGGSAGDKVTIAPSGGFAGNVAFTISGVPAGVTASFSPASANAAGATTLTLFASPQAATGTSAMTITGTSGAVSAKTVVTLAVNPPAANPSFSLSASPGSLSVTQGSSAAATTAVNPRSGFNSPVALTAGGLPAGVTASVSPASTTSSSTLTLTASASAAAASSNITVTGTSGALSQTVMIPLTIAAAAGGGGNATFAGTPSINGVWYDEDDVTLQASAPITAMSLTITVPATNVSFSGQYQTVGGQVATSHAAGGVITYSFVLGAGQTIYPGSYEFAAQLQGDGTVHAASGDMWTATYTSGGATYTQSGRI